jgi:predicted RNase H-like HicB family nuclease
MPDLLRHRRTQVYEVLAVVEEDEGGLYHGFCPALKGLHTSGKTVDETIENVKHAAVAYFLSLIKHGDPIPVGSFLREWTPPPAGPNVITRNILVSVAA